MRKVGDTKVEGGIKTTVTKIDPETGQISWSVDYTADYKKLFKDITDLMQTAKSVADATGEPFFKDHYLDIRRRRNELRTYLRNNKSEEYARIKGLDETSTAGGGNSFTSQAGTGAQYATPKAFSKKKKGKYSDGGVMVRDFGYKLVPKPHSTPGIEVKYLWGKK
jgi:hypothetical protein|tara:strand:- start:591 stop:1085 length:495 start_codon:yes stop_codon:yes gene_type:complete